MQTNKKHIHYYSDLKQGSEEWLSLRKNKITGTGAYTLLKDDSLERALKSNDDNSFKGNYYTKRGHVLEDESVEIYESIHNVKVENVGFVTNDKYPIAGYSPDGLVGNDGILECKSFIEEHHLANAESIDAKIVAQIQFGLLITERKWATLLLYNPELDVEKAFIQIDVPRNEIILNRLKNLLLQK